MFVLHRWQGILIASLVVSAVTPLPARAQQAFRAQGQFTVPINRTGFSVGGAGFLSQTFGLGGELTMASGGGEDGLIYLSIDGIARFPVRRPGQILVMPFLTGGLLIGPPKGGLKLAGGVEFFVHPRVAIRVEFVEALLGAVRAGMLHARTDLIVFADEDRVTQVLANLISKATDLRVWKYWRTLNMIGNFDRNPDPIIRDNIMLSAYLAEQVNLYEAATGHFVRTAGIDRNIVALWGGDGFHIVHYPLRKSTLFNIVTVFRTPNFEQRVDALLHRSAGIAAEANDGRFEFLQGFGGALQGAGIGGALQGLGIATYSLLICCEIIVALLNHRELYYGTTNWARTFESTTHHRACGATST
jgi:hypothetical protein